MTAPALIALAAGSTDPGSASLVREIVATTKRLRPELPIEAAFVDQVRPDLDTVVNRMAARGHREAVVVPLLLTSASDAGIDLPAAVHNVTERHDDIVVTAAGVIGPDAALLAVLDQRLREALRAARVREVDALVLAASGSSDARANASIARVARLWGHRHRLPTTVAFASSAPPSTGEAVREWRRQGKRYVAVGSFFVTPGKLTERAEELALEAGAVAVSRPLGAHEELARLILARYSVGALGLVPISA